MKTPADKNPAAAGGSNRLSSVLEASAPLAPTEQADNVWLVRTIVLAGLFVAAHWPILDWLFQSWLNNMNWSHGFLIPLFSAYLIYTRWADIRQCSVKAHWPGLLILLVALAIEVAVMVIPSLRNFSLYGLAMVMGLFGLVLYLCGWRLMRILWLPILYLALSVPAPGSLYTKVSGPLQEVAASGAVSFMRLCQVEIIQVASHLTLITQSGVEHQLTVAEACSGMHLLMAFFALGVAAAYLQNRPIWQRVTLVLAGIPIAVFCNVLRVIITATMYYIDKKELGQGVLHSFTGMIMLVPAFAMLWGLGWILDRMIIEEDDDDDQAADDESAAAGAVS